MLTRVLGHVDFISAAMVAEAAKLDAPMVDLINRRWGQDSKHLAAA